MLATLLMLALAADPRDLPDPVPLGITTLEVHDQKPGKPITTRYDILYIPRAEYLKKYGAPDDVDIRNLARTGFILRVETVHIGTY